MTNPILLDFPDEIETERLFIRACRPGDGRAVYEAIVESREHLRPWMVWADADQSEEDTEKNIREAVAKWHTREDLRMNIWRKADEYYIGGTGLHRINWKIPRFEIGYWVRAGCEGQGYITETVFALRDFAFEALNAQRVAVHCDPANERSAAVARRTGFELEVRLRNHARNTGGQLVDELIFALLRDEWMALRK